MKNFSLFSQPAEVWTIAWVVIFPSLQSGAVKPIVAKTFPLVGAADALHCLVEGRPVGRVILTIWQPLMREGNPRTSGARHQPQSPATESQQPGKVVRPIGLTSIQRLRRQ
jgi:hypothetical protein